MSLDYCGYIDHPDDCLCDVIIPHQTGWIGDAVQDMWMGPEISDLFGLDPDWDDESILKYLGYLVYAKDNWDTSKMTEARRTGSTAQAQLRENIRRRLQADSSLSIFDVISDLRLSYDDLMKVLFTNRRYMEPSEMKSFERDVKERRFHSAHQLGNRYGMDYKSARQLHSYWGVPFGEPEDTRPAHLIRLDELLAIEPQLKTKQILETIFQEFGVQLSDRKIINRRHYIKTRKM